MKLLNICAALLILAILPFPYGYYIFLRIAVMIISLYAAFSLVDRSSNDFWILIGLAILFNPVLPVFFSRLIWIPIDIIGAFYMFNLGKKLDK